MYHDRPSLRPEIPPMSAMQIHHAAVSDTRAPAPFALPKVSFVAGDLSPERAEIRVSSVTKDWPQNALKWD